MHISLGLSGPVVSGQSSPTKNLEFSHGLSGPYSPRLIFSTGIFLQTTQPTFFSTNSLGLAGPGKKNLNPKMALHPYGDYSK